MRITLPSGTAAEVVRPDGTPRVGLVVTPDIFGMRPHFDALAAGWARDWGMAVAVVDQYAGAQPGDDADVAARYAAVASIDDERHLADLHAAAVEWTVTRGSRSGRVAWQFIQDIAGKLGVAG